MTEFEKSLADGVDPVASLRKVYGIDEKGLRAEWYPWIIHKYGRGK